MSRFVTLRDEDGEVRTHAAGGFADYATLCGESDNDDMAVAILTSRGARIDCDACRSIYEAARLLKPKDFAS
jgi:hypothetical protein